MHKRIQILKPLCLTVITLLLCTSAVIRAQSRSRIVGVVKDAKTGEPLFGVNVIVKGTYLGAATDINGKYFIVNVPVGSYQVQASMIGYQSQLVTDVIVSSDRITTVDFELNSTVIQGKEVVVTAKRDNLHKEVANTQMVVTSSELKETSGIRQINAFLEKLPGVSTSNGFLTIRGGSADQTGSMINGLSYNNAAVGNAETAVPLSAIDQVSLLSGGYNAEYGNFRSGLINITTKTGSKDGYHGTFTLQRDNNHVRRFGDPFYSPTNSYLGQFLNPSTSFGTTKDFRGWNYLTSIYNQSASAENQATPFDMYLLANWLYMVSPDYAGLANLPDSVKQQIGYHPLTEQQKKAFAAHVRQEGGIDWNFDGGFGGPVPLIGKALGDATFYISNTSSEQHYVMPVTLNTQKSYTTLGTIKATPTKSLTFTYNGLWRREIGVSPVRPPMGDAPDASNAGGFMPLDNIKYVAARENESNSTGDRAYWYDAAFYPILDQTTVMNGVSINYILNPSTFWELTLSYLTINDYSPSGDNRDTTLITQFGPFPVSEVPYGKQQYASPVIDGFTYPSYMNNGLLGTSQRFQGKEGDLFDNSAVHQLSAKGVLASQIGEHNYVKAGIEYNYIDINHNFYEQWNNNTYNTYEFNYHRWPSQTGAFVQDQVTYEELVANVGVRLDYYYGGGGLWPSSDSAFSTQFLPQPQSEIQNLYSYLATGKSFIWDKWFQYNREHPGFLQRVKNYLTISPRVGVSFPVTANSKFYFNYGHFRSNPPYYTMYQLRYRYTKNGLYNMTNPNLEPPRTIQYELGIAYNFYQNYILQISGYSKDVTGEVGTIEYISADGRIDYRGQANNQYEDIEGLEINLTKNDNSWLNGWINFDYMLKKRGNTGYNTIRQGQVTYSDADIYHGYTRSLPQPTVNANITFRTPENWGPEFLDGHLFGDWNISFFAKYEAGDYFSSSDWNPLNLQYVSTVLEWPDYFNVDLKISKAFNVGGISTSFFLDVNNVFNLKNNIMSQGYAFQEGIGGNDFNNYMASLHLPMYNSPAYDQLRAQNPGEYIAGNDKPGDTKSASKPYIKNPANTFFYYGQPRDIWFGMRVDL